MKAWHVSNRYAPAYSTVVFAETRGKAMALAINTDACEDSCFPEISATRIPALDKYYRGLPEMDWYNAADRIALVKEANFHCTYEIDDKALLCDSCPAAEWCDRYEGIILDGRRDRIVAEWKKRRNR